MIKKNTVFDNKWWFWARGKGTHTCCDCGLVHDVVMQVTKNKEIKTKWVRNKKETLAERRKMKRDSKKINNPPMNTDTKQREIKFRAWDDGRMIHSHNNIFNKSQDQLSWFFDKIREDAIIMQYTGLKDKNSKEIYEGDIFEWHSGGKDGAGKKGDVYYEDGRFYLRGFHLGFLDDPNDAFIEGLHTISYIGNIL